MQKFNKGDKVRVRLDSVSTYKGYVGVVEKPVAEKFGFLYVVKFEKCRDLLPLNLFKEEDLEQVWG